MTITIGGREWVPPDGMLPSVRAAWAAFYRAAWTSYGIRPEQYRALYLAQSGRCYICRKAMGVHPDDPKGRGGRRLGIDHNHALGECLPAVRGLLCSGGDKTCNRIIGWLGRPALIRAADYLARPPAPVVLAALSAGADDASITGMVVTDAQDRSPVV